MMGIGSVGGFGGVDPAMFVGMSGAAGVSSAGAMSSTPAASTVATLAVSNNLQSLIQSIHQFGTTEVLLALLLSARSERTEQVEPDRTSASMFAALAFAGAAGQPAMMNTQFESAAPIAASAGAGMAINLSA